MGDPPLDGAGAWLAEQSSLFRRRILVAMRSDRRAIMRHSPQIFILVRVAAGFPGSNERNGKKSA
jgi:hypothetical protein